MENYPGPGCGGLVPTPTWVSQEDVPEIVERYLKSGYSIWHYQKMVQVIEQVLEKQLKGGGVDQFKLSARAKDKNSLRKKLVYRNTKNQYKEFDDIKKDIVDLAGVRIILYMPSDEGKVQDVIQNIWGKKVVPRKHPPPRDEHGTTEEDIPESERYHPRHLGYRATHYRVFMKDTKVETIDCDWLEHDQVEIQVVSALTHAWAEVGHDVLYKSYEYGPPSLEEARTLDALNGLIHSGDLLLEQFHTLRRARLLQPFEHREQLTSFLRTYFNQKLGEEDLERAVFPRGEGIFILFKFLEHEKLNSPIDVRIALQQLKYPFEHKQKEGLIEKSFVPPVDLAPNMKAIICLIRHLLREQPYEGPTTTKTTTGMCATMMSALTMLEFAFGSPLKAREYLLKLEMSDKEFQSINFLLGSTKRTRTLEGKQGQDLVRDQLKDAWSWFRNNAGQAKSFCGFLFRLAEMDCRKQVKPDIQITQLHIVPLSRSNTTDMNDDRSISPVLSLDSVAP